MTAHRLQQFDQTKPLLTIGIPTWNRSEELQECIELIAAQVHFGNHNVEIYVSDNASSDPTDALLCRMEQHLPFLRHSRNESNLGPDQNALEVLKNSSGEYVWLFSDDDFLADGALAEILRVIRLYRPSYITTNYLYCDGHREIANYQPQRRFMVRTDIAHADINRAFAERNHWMSFLSCNIYRRDLLNTAEYEVSKGKVSRWLQVFIAAHVLSTQPDGYLSSFDAVLSRLGNCRIDSSPFVAGMPEAFDYIFRTFEVDLKVRRQVIEHIRTTFLPFGSFLGNRVLNIEVSPLLIPHYYKLALLFPKSMVRIAWKTRRFFGGKGFSLPESQSI